MHTRVTLQCSYSRRLKHIDVNPWDIRRCLKSKYKHESKNKWPLDYFLKDGKGIRSWSCAGTVDSQDLRQDPLEAILVIFGRRALIFFLFESSWKK